MYISRCLLVALLVIASPMGGLGQSASYWLIKEATGRWEYREGTGEPRELTGKYDCLKPGGQVRCLDTDLRRCELRYLTDPRSTATRKLEVELQQSGQWVSLRNLKPPPPPLLRTTTADLVAKFKGATMAGGSRAASGCSGDFPLKSPACGDNIDISDFRVHWKPTTEDPARKLSVMVEQVDGKTDLFRGNTSASLGEFADARLNDFLRKIQGKNEAVDITVTIKADGGRSAVRLVHILPSRLTDQYETRVREIVSNDPFLRGVARMSLAMDEGMSSRAAEEACRLMDLAGGSPYLLEYALAGLCQSDFEDERTRLRKYVPDEKYKRICAPASAPAAGKPEAIAPPPAAAAAVSGDAPAKSRLGIALLIGNWDYWNLPLNSVKSDLQHMSETLETLGFRVTVKENVRGPQQFAQALGDMLAEEKANSEDVLFVYYSGHGVQLDGKAYLLGTGVSATAQVAEDVRANAESAEGLLARMERAEPGTRILVVEACRNSVFSTPTSLGGQAPRAGFAFQQDDVPNTFVMFANKPGLPTPVRSDYGLMGPFTESLIYALQNSTGEIGDVYEMAAKKTMEISPGQEPVMHHSKSVDRVILRQEESRLLDNRAKDLLNSAEVLYRHRAWYEFGATVARGRALASAPELQQRLAREVEFARLVVTAEGLEDGHKWADAAANWQKAGEIFPARQWVTMKTAVGWLLADDLSRAVRSLAVLTAQSDSDPAALQARQMLAELVKAFPALEADARKIAQETARISGAEFEPVKREE
jgi:hypothetical protein